MKAWMESFRQSSMKKYESLSSESSEIFRKQTGFKDFESELVPKKISDSLGFKIIENPRGVKVSPIEKSDVKEIMGRFDIEDKFAQMNNAFFDSGAVIEVPKGFDAETLRISSSPAGSLFSKLIIVMQEDSRMEIVKECYSADENPGIFSEDVLVIAHPDSSLTFSELQNYNKSSTCMSNKIAVCGKGAKVSWNIGSFGGSRIRTRTYNLLEGDGSMAEDRQITFGDGEQYFDAFSNLSHIGRSTSARAIAKGAFKDRSNSIFKGMINIEGKAKNASSYLACHGMLLGKNAKANAIPSLEIKTNEVKATHAASVSPIDEEKVFYLVSRGLSREEARKMITIGFFDPVIRGIESEEIRSKMRYLVEAKWDGRKTESFDAKMLREFMTEDAIKSGDIFEGHYKYR